MTEQESSTPVQNPRRRRKPRRPKWVTNKITYIIWRNWPLIRFVLICALLLIMLCSMVRCAVGAIGGLFKDDGPSCSAKTEGGAQLARLTSITAVPGVSTAAFTVGLPQS